MIKGYLSEFVKIVPFSVETASEGRKSLFHKAIVASSVKILIGLTSGLIGILFSTKYFSKLYLIIIDLNFLLKGPVYEINALANNTSPAIN
jgi:hypothetical protein